MSRSVSAFPNEGERLAAIEKTIRETSVPPELEIRKVVADAIAAYWTAREKDLENEPKEAPAPLEIETAELNRAFAIRLAIRPVVRDAIGVEIPVLVAFVFCWFYLRSRTPELVFVAASRDNRLTALTIFALTVLVSLGVAASFSLIGWSEDIDRIAFIVRFGAGVVIGALALSVVWSSYELRLGRLTSALEARGNEFQQAVLLPPSFSSGGEWAVRCLAGHPRPLHNAEFTLRGTMACTSRDIPGKLQWTFDSGKGSLAWIYRNKSQIQVKFIIGTVERTRGDSLILRDSEAGAFHSLNKGPLAPQVAPGSRVALANNETKETVGLIRTLNPGSS